MNDLRSAITKVFKGAAKSFYRFPAAIASAIVISIVTIVRISMDWEAQQAYSFLFNSIQLSFILGAVFSMAAVTLEEIKTNKTRKSFLSVNIAGIIVAIISFLLLYFFGGKVSENGITYLTSISTARILVAIFISAVAFVYMISKAKSVEAFSDAFFITHKAFAISFIYGIVIMAGVSGVLGAFQALVYRDMSGKIYQYLSVAVGLLTYTIFLGYFPNFRESEKRDEIKNIEEQPRFIFVLFGYILVPIITALTVVLLIWSARVMLRGVDVPFNRLSSIASSYVIAGIWLHIMVAKHQTKIAEFYKKAYPFSAILILIFEAWALIVQLNKFGLKVAEYSFIMIWIFAIISVLLLIFLKDKGYRKIAITAVIISVIWVLPIIGYQDITFNSQVNRLEGILIDEGILVNNNIISTDKEIERVKKGEITDAVDFIALSDKTNTPTWFKKDLNNDTIFKDTFGFEKTYGVYPDAEQTDFMSTNLMLATDIIDISDYSLSLNIGANEKSETLTSFEGEDGNYEIDWVIKPTGVLKITVKLNDGIIIEEDMESYLSDLMTRYPPQENTTRELPLEDMSVVLEGENISMLLVFENINIFFDRRQNRRDYYTNLQGIYIKYK